MEDPGVGVSALMLTPKEWMAGVSPGNAGGDGRCRGEQGSGLVELDKTLRRGGCVWRAGRNLGAGDGWRAG